MKFYIHVSDENRKKAVWGLEGLMGESYVCGFRYPRRFFNLATAPPTPSSSIVCLASSINSLWRQLFLRFTGNILRIV